MKELRTNYDSEAFSDLEEAKKYYMPNAENPCSENEYLGEDYKNYCTQWDEYKKEIEKADSLELLAQVLNRYSDIFGNNKKYFVKEF